jgi:hypothetical protein
MYKAGLGPGLILWLANLSNGKCDSGIRMGVGGMDWIELAQDRDRWRELVNAVMNVRVL